MKTVKGILCMVIGAVCIALGVLSILDRPKEY